MSEDATRLVRRRWSLTALPFTRLGARWSRGMAIAAIAIAAVLAGHIASAQIAPPPSLKSVKVPEPDNLGEFIQDKTAAIALGKTLFWDMQIGSDGIQSCATCHFHAGADSRSKNQLGPGLLRVNTDNSENPDQTFQTGGANYQLKPEDFPFHKLENPNNRSSKVVRNTNDIVSSQGVFNAEFRDVVPGKDKDLVDYKPDTDGFQVGNTNVRRVEPRNTPTVINAVYNFRQFWDGRGQNVFNGVNPFGTRDPHAKVYKVVTTPKNPKNPKNPKEEETLEPVPVRLKNSSLAAQAVGPPLSSFEMSADGRTFEEIGDKLGSSGKDKSADKEIAANKKDNKPDKGGGIDKHKSASKGKKLPRKSAKKLLPLRPLGKQIVHPEDSVLGKDSRYPQPGLKTDTYQKLIEKAFKPQWWNSEKIIQIKPDGSREIVKKPDKALTTQEYTLMEYNFSLFFGLAVQMYESTLVSDNTPFDQFREGNANALTSQQKDGLNIFLNSGCIFCHIGAEFTAASVSNVNRARLTESPAPGNPIEDTGLFNIGVTPTLEDISVGAQDNLKPQSRSLSEAVLAKQGKFKELFGEDPKVAQLNGQVAPFNNANIVVAEGHFKAPTLRNVELTAPYMHNGGMLTLEQVVEFYSRGAGDDNPQIPRLPVLNLNPDQQKALVAFIKGLTDERVRLEKAPFDHPQLFIPNGHPGNQTSVTNDGTGKATDALLEIPAIGRNGRSAPPKNFLEASDKAAPAAAPSAPGAGYSQQDCPSGTSFKPLPGGFVCQ
ncbi:MAG TPA: cytochrome c peroxidase [Coleofasciculaceae cyanobacterium]